MTLACVVGDAAHARGAGLTDRVPMFNPHQLANPSTDTLFHPPRPHRPPSSSVVDTGGGPAAAIPTPAATLPAAAAAETTTAVTGVTAAASTKDRIQDGIKDRGTVVASKVDAALGKKKKRHRTTVSPLPIGSFSPSSSPDTAKGSPTAAPTSKGVPSAPPTAFPTDAVPSSTGSPVASMTWFPSPAVTAAPSGSGDTPSSSPSSYDPDPKPTSASPSATPTIIIRPVRPKPKPKPKTPIACRKLRQASIKALCGTYYDLGYANCTAVCNAERHDQIVEEFNISGCNDGENKMEFEDDDSHLDGALFYAQEFCSGSVDDKDAGDQTAFEEKAESAAGGALFGGISVCVFNNRRSLWAWFATVICAVATTVGVADRARAAKRRRYESGDIEAAATDTGDGLGDHGGGEAQSEYEGGDEEGEGSPFSLLEPPPPLSPRPHTSGEDAGTLATGPATATLGPATATPVLPSPTPLDSETKEALEVTVKEALEVTAAWAWGPGDLSGRG